VLHIFYFTHGAFHSNHGAIRHHIRERLQEDHPSILARSHKLQGRAGSTAPGPRQTRLQLTSSVFRRRPAAGPHLGSATLSSAPHIAQAPRSPGAPRRFVGARRSHSAGLWALWLLCRAASENSLVLIESLVATPRPLAPACGRQGPHLRGFLSESCAAR